MADIGNGPRSVRTVSLRQLEKGLTSAAITATGALCIGRPNVLVMTGICAGVRGTVNLGDLIVATQCFEHSSGQLLDGQLIPLQNRVSIQPWPLDLLMSLTDSPALLDRIQAGFGKSLPAGLETAIHLDVQHPSAHHCPPDREGDVRLR